MANALVGVFEIRNGAVGPMPLKTGFTKGQGVSAGTFSLSVSSITYPILVKVSQFLPVHQGVQICLTN
jgi:hypothetical protein